MLLTQSRKTDALKWRGCKRQGIALGSQVMIADRLFSE